MPASCTGCCAAGRIDRASDLFSRNHGGLFRIVAGENSFISTSELLDVINQKDGNGEKVPFSIGWVTLDQTRKDKPSKRMRLAAAVTCGSRLNLVRHGMVAVRPVEGGQPRHIYLDLIEEVNGRTHA